MLIVATPSALPEATTLVVLITATLALMLGFWAVQWRSRNAGWADFGWTVCIGLLGVGAAAAGHGLGERRMLVGSMVGLWAVRLAFHLWRDRLFQKPEEGRYVRLRAHWGERANTWFIVFFLAQGALALVLALPFWIAANATQALRWSDVAAVLVFLGSLGFEHVADQQLHRFKSDPANKGRVCRSGLWQYSRHPNYFFEWLVWCAYALLALPSERAAWAWLSPAIMLLFVLKISGVPTSERQALSSRGDAYRAYQRTTSVFVPWPPKADADADELADGESL